MAAACIHQCHYVRIYHCVRRWIHNWPQGSCNLLASALSALPLFQFAATICGGPSAEGSTRTMQFLCSFSVLVPLHLSNLSMIDLQAIELIAESSDLVAKLQENTNHFRTRMTEAGFELMVRTTFAGGVSSLDTNLLSAGKSASNCTHSP